MKRFARLRPRVGPVTQIALGLAMMACVLVLVANAAFGVFGDGENEGARARRIVAETLATQGAVLIQRGDTAALRELMTSIATRDPRIGSIAFRRAGGVAVAQIGDPARWWSANASDDGSTRDRLRVPLFSTAGHWGDLEIGYRHAEGGRLMRWITEPIVLLIGFVFVGGALGFGLFMRRVLQHLDPSSAIPERVRTAFDTLVEGIAILDGEGRIVVANQALRRLRADVEVADGVALSSLGWRRAESGADDAHPWDRAMRESRVVGGVSMRLGIGDGAREVVVSCSPIRDGRDAVRGCMVSFSDVTEVSRANAQLRLAMADLERSRLEVEATNRALQRAATRDPLTDLLNRRAFAELGEPIHRRARGGHGEPVTALLLDIDHFKSINDRFGHAVGDKVICAVAATLRDGVRPQDVVSRHGGEEFAVLLPGSDAEHASVIAERLRIQVETRCEAAFGAVHAGLRVTVSIGVGDTVIGGATLDALLDEADSALYRAKRGGRNRVCVHDPALAA
jgi:diguanylate cyclase (GGDEF)-like protein